MSSFPKLLLPTLLLTLVSVESAGICKWTDENGVVHYAESCPEDSQSSEVEIAPPPSPEQAEAARQRMEETRARSNARKQQAEQQKEQQLLERNQQTDTGTSKLNACAEARWNLSILRQQLPVYYDENRQLHTNRSLHDSWYVGQRNYINDQQREAEIERLSRIEAESCTSSEDDIRERIRTYMQKDHQQACLSLRDRLKRMRQASTGIPSDDMRELEELINTRCQ